MFVQKSIFGFTMAMLLVVNLPSVMEASNLYQVHQDAFSFAETWEYLNGTAFSDQDYFPVAWDVRQAYRSFRDYGIFYCNNNPSELQYVFENLLTEARDAGINLAFIRNELGYTNPNATEFAYISDLARLLGMHVLAGGFKACITSSDPHNEEVLGIIVDYLNAPSPHYPGSVIGGGGMDCPDGKEYSENQPLYHTGTAHYANQFEVVGLDNLKRPFTAFLERQGYTIAGEWVWLPEYIYSYCSIMSLPTYDMYPCHLTTSIERFSPYSAEIWTAADVWPETGNYYQAYANRDELIALNPGSSGTISLSVYEIEDFPENNEMTLTPVAEGLIVPGLNLDDFEIASSGPVSSDCGDRLSGEHELSGGIALWKPYGSPAKIRILYHHDATGLKLGALREWISIPEEITRFVAMGQDDYLADHNSYNATGVMCQDEMRVLHCFDNPRGTFVRLFKKPEPGETVFSTASSLLEIPFQPTGAVWGYFWPSGNWMYYRSGFVLYDESGEYAVVHRDDSQPDETWTVTPRASGQDMLFGDLCSEQSLVEVDVYRSYRYRPYNSPVKDYIVGTVTNNVIRPFTMDLVTRIGDNSSVFQFPGEPHTIEVVVEPPVSSVSNVVIRSAGSNKCRMFFNYTYGSTNGMFRTPMFDDDLCDEELTQISSGYKYTNWCTSEGYALRIRASRRADTNALTIESGEPYILDSRADMGLNHTAFTRLHESIDYEHIWGVVKPDSIEGQKTCLMTTVQAFGRRHFGTVSYCPSLDSLMYMSISPVIHGSRALLFYSLGSALEGSNGGIADNRLPWVMTGWGGSNDPEHPEMDMVSTVHSAVALLTGNTYGAYQSPVDFLSATIDDDWLAMPDMIRDNRLAVSRSLSDQVAYLREYKIPIYDEPGMNFLALQNASTEEVLIMVANDSSYYAPPYHIYLPDYTNAEWDVECVYAEENWKSIYYPGGRAVADEADREELSSLSNGSDDMTRIHVIVEDLPPFTAALFRVIPDSDEDARSSTSAADRISLNIRNNAHGPVDVQVSVEAEQNFTLTVFDLTGRAVSQEDGTGDALFRYSTANHPTGTYFVMLKVGENTTTKRILLLP